MMNTIKYLAAAALILGPMLVSEALPNRAMPRERISINDNWRFSKGDPNGDSTGLIYDVRPEVKDKKDDKAADAEPTEAEKIAATNRVVLKPWILPMANAFIKDPANRHARPAANVATNVSYTQFNFDDSSWSVVNLPHDPSARLPLVLNCQNIRNVKCCKRHNYGSNHNSRQLTPPPNSMCQNDHYREYRNGRKIESPSGETHNGKRREKK